MLQYKSVNIIITGIRINTKIFKSKELGLGSGLGVDVGLGLD